MEGGNRWEGRTISGSDHFISFCRFSFFLPSFFAASIVCLSRPCYRGTSLKGKERRFWERGLGPDGGAGGGSGFLYILCPLTCLACLRHGSVYIYISDSLTCVPLGCLVSDGCWGGVCVYLKRGWCCVAWACSAPQREWWLSMRQRNGLVRVSFGSGTTPVEIAGMALSAPPRLGWAGPLQVSSDVCVAVID